ncbi:ATP-binding protein [Caballeronia sp. S22]|uniref:hybrid sensor histidine kinase/response regulator n=1 Tax=Caballeronia sp. S22 TaxID=3137182 RepID=UPI0035309A95
MDVLVTAGLDDRSHRSPDYAAENEALHVLAKAFTASETVMLQTLVDTALALCDAGSAGISLRERDALRPSAFRWAALSGCCSDMVGHVIPTDNNSPAGVALELDAPQLFAYPKRRFACLADVTPEITEQLVVPVPGLTEPWGALWVMSHDERRHFDSEHRRLLTSLASFTCAALSTAQAKAEALARAEEAETARNALAAAEAEKDRFIAVLGHELRNPLGPIDTGLEAAQKLAANSPAVLSALALVNRQVAHLRRLVNDLLDASRIRHEKLSIVPAYCLLGDIVKDSVAAVSEEAEQRQQQLHTTMPPYPVSVIADAGRLTQVIANLLRNSVKYTPARGEISLRVDAPDPATLAEHDSAPREAVITVRDNGVGIEPGLLPGVFEMFAQSPSVLMRSEGGLGLGLSVVRYLVQAHQGQVSISSEGEGQGTEVTLRLPIVCRSRVKHTSATTHGIAHQRILLVDDSADATEALAMLLTLDGHEVKRAQSAAEALAIVESFTPDVALIDVNMPEIDGRELAGMLRQRVQCSETRLVALSGVAFPEPAGAENKFDCYLLKPPSLEELADVLRR